MQFSFTRASITHCKSERVKSSALSIISSNSSDKVWICSSFQVHFQYGLAGAVAGIVFLIIIKIVIDKKYCFKCASLDVLMWK